MVCVHRSIPGLPIVTTPTLTGLHLIGQTPPVGLVFEDFGPDKHGSMIGNHLLLYLKTALRPGRQVPLNANEELSMSMSPFSWDKKMSSKLPNLMGWG